jgi:hypothetical protein
VKPDAGKQAEAIISKHVIRFMQPEERILSHVSVYAPVLGNGFTGVALSGKPEKVTGIPGGILYPVGIGPLGIETTRWNPLMEKYSFHQIRVEGAFLVSATLKNGSVTELSIYSEQGRPLCLLNPWKDSRVSVCEWTHGKRTGQHEYTGERISLPTKKNTTYVFRNHAGL